MSQIRYPCGICGTGVGFSLTIFVMLSQLSLLCTSPVVCNRPIMLLQLVISFGTSNGTWHFATPLLIFRRNTALCDVTEVLAERKELVMHFYIWYQCTSGCLYNPLCRYLNDIEITEKQTEFTRVEDENDYKLIIKEVAADLTGNYACRVTNDLGLSDTTCNLTVHCK